MLNEMLYYLIVVMAMFEVICHLNTVLVVDRIRGSGLEGSSLLLIFAGERKGSSPWPGARAFKGAHRRKHQLDFPRISTKNVKYFNLTSQFCS
jgi:hypothetical protein